MIEVVQFHVKNFSKRAPASTIDSIVIHDTGGHTAESALKWFERKESQVSAHYVIDKDGTIYECVPCEEKAWHAGVSNLHGKSNVNEFSIGVELVDDSDGDKYPEKQMDSLVRLCCELAYTYKISMNRIVGHEHVAPGRKVDPGKDFPWFTFLAAVGSCVIQKIIEEYNDDRAPL